MIEEIKMHSYICNESFDKLIHEAEVAIFKKEAEGYYWLGKIYQHGFGKEKDIKLAILNYEKASEMGCSNATIHLASLYYCGNEVNKDEQKAYQLAFLAARQQNVDGQIITSICYGEGIGVECDINQALYYNDLAINQGSNIARKLRREYNLSVVLKREHYGDLVTLKELFKLVDEYTFYSSANNYFDYRKAARKGVVKAYYDLAYCYEKGIGVERNLNQAIDKYEKCIDLQYYYAYGGLDRCYEQKDIYNALRYYRYGVLNGYSEFEDNISNLYDGNYLLELGHKLRNSNILLAMDYYTKANELGNDEAYYYLGLCSYKIEYKDSWDEKEKTFHYFLQAADLGNVEAQMIVAYCYFYGRGIERHSLKSNEYCELATQNGFIEVYKEKYENKDLKEYKDFFESSNCLASLYNLGQYYLMNSQENESIRKALTCFKKLARKGYLDSNQLHIEIYLKHMVEIHNQNNIMLDEVMHSLNECADCNHADASYLLGICYEKGLMGCKVDLEKANMYYEEAKRSKEDKIERLVSNETE